MRIIDLIKDITQEQIQEYSEKYNNALYDLEYEFGDDRWCQYKQFAEEIFRTHVVQVPVKTWICTDTEVGMNAYYVKIDCIWVLFAVSYKPYRKYDTTFQYISRDLHDHVRNIWLSCLDNEEDIINTFTLEDEVDEFYTENKL